MMRKFFYLLVIGGFLITTRGFAATSSSTFAVSAVVTDLCLVIANPLTISLYNPTASPNVDGTSTMLITCSSGAPYDIGLDAGTGTGATVTTRKMTSGSNTLDYSLYQDAGYTTIWGNTIGTDTVAGSGDGLAQTLTVYGRIPGNQHSAPIGLYTDTITVTITY